MSLRRSNLEIGKEYAVRRYPAGTLFRAAYVGERDVPVEVRRRGCPPETQTQKCATFTVVAVITRPWSHDPKPGEEFSVESARMVEAMWDEHIAADRRQREAEERRDLRERVNRLAILDALEALEVEVARTGTYSASNEVLSETDIRVTGGTLDDCTVTLTGSMLVGLADRMRQARSRIALPVDGEPRL